VPEIYQNNHNIFSDLILVEGTQYQLLIKKYNLAKLEKIFISYSHNDHYLDCPKELVT
jgi:Metal-dependent hydrolases of the beta-lactamase superfamily III